MSEFCRNHEKYGNRMPELQEEMISVSLRIGMFPAVFEVLGFLSREKKGGY